ncbi:MAG: hypothetical protein ABIN23_04950 [candidate division WOR-3 bacterium]|nr:hypothetical protein [Candidatus Omnitrophota bacterium]
MKLQRGIKLIEILRIPSFRVLLWDENYLYGSRGYTVYRINSDEIENKNINLEKVGFFRSDLIRKLSSKSRLLSRLFRAGFHCIRKIHEKIIGIVAKNIVLLEPDEKEFRSVFKIDRGTRPLGIAVTSDGKIFFGEYFNNPNREEVHIYYSEDGYKWEIVYTFPKKTIRHIHNVLHDPYEDCLWILTGDYGKEAKIIKASIDFKNVDIILEGTQQARAVSMIFRKDKIFYATDTEIEQNYIYSIDRKTYNKEKLFPIPGPSLWSCEVGDSIFFSTHHEPGKFSNIYAYLIGSKNEKEWEELLQWEKDSLNPKLFQYPAIILPYGKSERYLAGMGRAVKNNDNYTIIWEVWN